MKLVHAFTNYIPKSHLMQSTHLDLTPNGCDITREREGRGREGERENECPEVFNWL
jgi:hypothetical protein